MCLFHMFVDKWMDTWMDGWNDQGLLGRFLQLGASEWQILDGTIWSFSITSEHGHTWPQK